jgi:hypothetical protein
VAEPDDDISKINPSEVETLIKKIEHSTLSEQDKRMIARLLRTLLQLVKLLQEEKVTLLRLIEFRASIVVVQITDAIRSANTFISLLPSISNLEARSSTII